MRHRFISLGDAARGMLKEMLGGGQAGDPAAGADAPHGVHAECAGLVNALITERLGTPLRTWSVL